MKAQKLILITILCICCIDSYGQEKKYMRINQPIERKINHIRIAPNANANILYLKTNKENANPRLEIDGGMYLEDTINAISKELKNICKIIDDTLIVYDNKKLKDFNIRLQIRLTEPIISITLDSKANASIEFKHDVEQFRLIANQYSQCTFPTAVHFDSIYIEGKENSSIAFEDIYVVNYINMTIEPNANFTAKRGGFNTEGTQEFRIPLNSSNINLFGSKYPQIENMDKKKSIWTLDKGIERVGYPGFNFSFGATTLIASNNNDIYKSNIGLSSNIDFWFPINLTNRLAIYTGANFTADVINFQNPLTINDNKLSIYNPESEVGISNYKSQMSFIKIGIPIMFKYKLDVKKKIGILIGVVPNYNLNTSTSGLVNTFEKNGKTYDEYFNNKDYLNKFQLDSKLSIDYNGLQFYFSYGLIPIFDTHIEQRVNILKFGISWDVMGTIFK